MSAADASAPLSGTSEVLAGFGTVKRLEAHGPVTLFTGFSDEHDCTVILHRVDAAAVERDPRGQRFLEVARASLGLRHARLLPPLSLRQMPDGAWCLCSVWAPGATLADELERTGPLSLEHALQLVLTLCQGLVSAHARGLVHAAIRPELIILGPRGVSDARLSGFATAALPWPQGTFSSREAPGFSAPELIARQPVGFGADIYSLAAVLCTAVSGRSPFADMASTAPGSPPAAFRFNLPPALGELQTVVARCLAPDPSRRPRSVEELMTELGKTGDTIVPVASPPSAALPMPQLPPPRGQPGHEKPGDVLGAYALVKELGEGSMGKVFLARHVMLGRQVALKILKAEQLDRPELISRFFQEARSVNQINHEHIVEVFDFVQEQGAEGLQAVYCVMELLKGQTLSAATAEVDLSIQRVAHIMAQVCDALAAAHQVGVVHRDLKPDNIFLIERGGQADYVKVLDFGVAKLTTLASDLPLVATVDGVVIGTPAYMSPEQVSGMDVDHRSDIHAVGVMIHELLTGRLPYEASNFALLSAQIITKDPPLLPATARSGEPIPEGLRALVARILRKNALLRPQSMAEVRAMLLPFARGEVPAPLRPALATMPPVPPLPATLASAAAVPAAPAQAPPAPSAPSAPTAPSAPPAPPAPSAPSAPAVPTVPAPAASAPAPAQQGSTLRLLIGLAFAAVVGATAVGVSQALTEREVSRVPPPLLQPPVQPPPLPLARVTPPPVEEPQHPAHSPEPPPPVAPPPVAKERPAGPLTVEEIGRTVTRSKAKLLGCVALHQSELPQSNRTVKIELTIRPSGVVSHAQVKTEGLEGTQLAGCIAKQAQRIRFPKHSDPEFTVEVPFLVRDD